MVCYCGAPSVEGFMILLMPRLKGGERTLEVLRLICLLNRNRLTVYLSMSIAALAFMVFEDGSRPGEIPRAVLLFGFIGCMIWFVRWFAKKDTIR
jgi:hypothetical protein